MYVKFNHIKSFNGGKHFVVKQNQNFINRDNSCVKKTIVCLWPLREPYYGFFFVILQTCFFPVCKLFRIDQQRFKIHRIG